MENGAIITGYGSTIIDPVCAIIVTVWSIMDTEALIIDVCGSIIGSAPIIINA